MSAIFVSRAFARAVFVASAVLSTQVQARPADPQWNPAAQGAVSPSHSCGPVAKRVAYGPRPLDVIVGSDSRQSVTAQVSGPRVGPRGTIILERHPIVLAADHGFNIC